MIKITRVRAFRPRQGDGEEFGIDFTASGKQRTVYVDQAVISNLENLLIVKGWMITPSLFPGGYWSARKVTG